MENVNNSAAWPLWEGYISDNEVYLGAPGYEHKQERTLGYFTVGNRGTGDSRPKTIIIDYDVNNTNIAGVTAQALPFISRDRKDGTEATKVTDFKVTLWNSKTGELFERTVDHPKQRFIVSDALGEYQENVFIKHIEYKIDKIPAKTEFNCYLNNSSVGSGYESERESRYLSFYGQVLTNEVRQKGLWGEHPSLFKTRIRIENTGAEEPNWHHRNQDKWGDEILKYPGRSYDHVTIGDTFTAFTGKSFIQGHNNSFAYHRGNPLSFVAGDKVESQEFSYRPPTWDGSKAGQQTYKAIYYISPLGDDLSFKMMYRSVGAKESWKTKDVVSDKNVSTKQPDVYVVPASDELKKKYPNAKVYKLDFSKYKTDQDVYDTRSTGPGVYWREEADKVPYAINDAYWGYTADSYPLVSFTSDPQKDIPGTYNELMWFEYDTDTKENLVYSDKGFAKDKWDLNGNGSTEDMLGAPCGSWEISAATDVVVNSAAKMATQPDSKYVTYDGQSKTGIGANSTVDYRLIASNPSTQDAKGLKIYWTVPKKGQDWGEKIQPKGAFQFDTFLNGGIKTELPQGYKVYYYKNATPTHQALLWDTYERTEGKDTASWTQKDWDAVNLVCIESPEDSVFSSKRSETFKFNLAIHDIAPEDFEKNLLNVYTPIYLRDLGSGKGYRYGQPVAMTPLPGIIAGTAWVDADRDGEMDSVEQSDVVPGVKVELYDAHGELVNMAVTDEHGKFIFRGLKIWKSEDKDIDIYTVKVYNLEDPASTSKEFFAGFSPLGKNMVYVADKDQKSASVDGITTSSPNAQSLDIGLVRSSGSIEILKIDAKDEKKVLSGASFELRQGETVIQKGTTNQEGKLIFNEVPYGEYEIYETQAPEGYQIETNSQKVTVSEREKTVQVTFKDKPEEKVPNITKNDEKTKKIPKTGNHNALLWYALLVGVSLTLLIKSRRKKV